MRRVLVDSGGFFACLVAEDACHTAAIALFSRARYEHWQLVTTNAVSIAAGLCWVERVTKRDEARAVELLRKHADKTYSLCCDALSFTVMERLRTREVIGLIVTFGSTGV